MRPDLVNQSDDGELVEQIGGSNRQPIEQMLNAPVIRRAGATHRAHDLVAFVQQELGEVRPILPGDSGDDRSF